MCGEVEGSWNHWLMEKSVSEQVMCVPTYQFREVGWFHGITRNVKPYMDGLLEENCGIVYIDREVAETDPSYKQIIPYVIFRCGDEILHYRRAKGSGETRLLKKRSIGIGGHINNGDTNYWAAMAREINEEVLVDGKVEANEVVAVVHDASTEVGDVHLGIVHLLDVAEKTIVSKEEAIAEIGWSSVQQLIEESQDDFEKWSQFCLLALWNMKK